MIDSIPGTVQALRSPTRSGHGPDFARAIDAVLADRATTGDSRFNLASFRLDRFRQAA